MPIFEYNCASCDHHFEIIVLSPREKISCPKCTGKKVGKQLSVFSAPASTSGTAPNPGVCTGTPQSCGCR
ncbi:MAG TPA: FmdB family zinc ribbon protein [Candidatus Limnocylindrales bacterium]|nr:FmdB family zinc ribbon protein [Candidatus Limnocylindrales bacterium]